MNTIKKQFKVFKMSKNSDKKIYIAFLKLLKGGETITVEKVAAIAGVTRGLVYYKMQNLYLKEGKK